MMMRRAVGIAGALALGLSVAASSAFAQVAPDNSDALKCQTGQGSNTAKFVGAKAKCAMKCLGTARKTSGPYTECKPPYSGATATCINDPIKGAEAKALAANGKSCVKDCPDCYADNSPSDCPNGAGFVANAEAQVDAIGPLVFCSEEGMTPTTPTKEQAKCEDTIAKTLVKYVGAASKCVSKCVSGMFKGSLPPGSCDPNTPSDMKTADCLNKAGASSTAAIDKVCGVNNPPCYSASLDSGAEWTALVKGAVASTAPGSFCGM